MSSLLTDPLLEPFQLGPLTLRNRVVSTSHEPAFSQEGMPKERYAAYHVEKAKGGVALTMIGGSAVVSPDSPPAFGNLLMYKDEIVPWLSRLTEQVHEHGAAVMCQITHLGRRTSNYAGDWLPVLAPSPLREPAHRAFPKQAEDWDLDRVVADYASAAQRAVAGGLDGIELEAYGHLLDGFLSPATNRRTDGWGGSPEARLRLALAVVRSIRDAVGTLFPVGMRLVVDEDMSGGIDADAGIAAARRLVAEGIDFISVIRGHIDTDEGLAKVIPPMGTPSAPHLEFAGWVKKELGVPVMHASRIADVATARHAIRDGLLDLVGMTRAQIADPYLVAKIAAGQEDRIRPCVGAGYCLDAIYQASDTKCIHNAATGRELLLPHHVPPSSGPVRKVVVIGAGAAGLEAARVLGERGHQVVVLEAAPEAGGQLLLAARSAARKDLLGIVDWRLSESARRDVQVRYNTYADVSTVMAEAPDVVVVATGGMPDTGFLESGAELVLDTWDVLAGSARLGGDVLLYDDHGGHSAMDAAATIAEAGARLHIVTPERTLAMDVGGVNYPRYFGILARADARTTLLQRLRSVRRSGDGRLVATLFSEYGRFETELTVDQVVVEHGTLPNDDLYHGLVAGSSNLGAVDHRALLSTSPQAMTPNPAGTYQLFRIGDAVAGRNVHAAILDAYRLCLAI